MREKSKKSMADILKQIRNSWNINPRTRIQKNELADKKKRRQMEKKLVKDVEDKHFDILIEEGILRRRAPFCNSVWHARQ